MCSGREDKSTVPVSAAGCGPDSSVYEGTQSTVFSEHTQDSVCVHM
jgi:hypothetical protein